MKVRNPGSRPRAARTGRDAGRQTINIQAVFMEKVRECIRKGDIHCIDHVRMGLMNPVCRVRSIAINLWKGNVAFQFQLRFDPVAISREGIEADVLQKIDTFNKMPGGRPIAELKVKETRIQFKINLFRDEYDTAIGTELTSSFFIGELSTLWGFLPKDLNITSEQLTSMSTEEAIALAFSVFPSNEVNKILSCFITAIKAE